MRQLEWPFRELGAISKLDRDTADQLSHAARALAEMPRLVATAITCTRYVAYEQHPALAALARALAAKNSLGVRIELGDPVRIRFTRGDDP